MSTVDQFRRIDFIMGMLNMIEMGTAYVPTVQYILYVCGERWTITVRPALQWMKQPVFPNPPSPPQDKLIVFKFE